jgi:hypothetical protein
MITRSSHSPHGGGTTSGSKGFGAASKAIASWKRPRSYSNALAEQLAIRRPATNLPVRLVVGYLRIVLVVENCPPEGWRMLDYFPLESEHDRDLRLVTQQMQRVGYPRGDIKADLSPAVFSPCGAKDEEAQAAMARLGRHGFAISNEITGIRDPEFLWLVDGRPRTRARVR